MKCLLLVLYSLTIVNAFLQLAKATRLVGFSVMQFTMDLNVKRERKCISQS